MMSERHLHLLAAAARDHISAVIVLKAVAPGAGTVRWWPPGIVEDLPAV